MWLFCTIHQLLLFIYVYNPPDTDTDTDNKFFFILLAAVLNFAKNFQYRACWLAGAPYTCHHRNQSRLNSNISS